MSRLIAYSASDVRGSQNVDPTGRAKPKVLKILITVINIAANITAAEETYRMVIPVGLDFKPRPNPRNEIAILAAINGKDIVEQLGILQDHP